MKVDVIQADEIRFKKYQWWSNWIDIAVFNYECAPFLLQMRVNRFNKKQFNTIRMTGLIMYRPCNIENIGDLTQMNSGEK